MAETWDMRCSKGSRSLADTKQPPSELGGPDCFWRGAALRAELQSSPSADVFPRIPFPCAGCGPGSRQPLFHAAPGAEPWAVTFCTPRMQVAMPCWEVCVCQLARGGVADPVPAGVPPHPAPGPAGTSAPAQGARHGAGTALGSSPRGRWPREAGEAAA